MHLKLKMIDAVVCLLVRVWQEGKKSWHHLGRDRSLAPLTWAIVVCSSVNGQWEVI